MGKPCSSVGRSGTSDAGSMFASSRLFRLLRSFPPTGDFLPAKETSSMTRYHKALGVFLVSLFGVWGCARGSATNGTAGNDKIKALEAKTAKLEDDLKN